MTCSYNFRQKMVFTTTALGKLFGIINLEEPYADRGQYSYCSVKFRVVGIFNMLYSTSREDVTHDYTRRVSCVYCKWFISTKKTEVIVTLRLGPSYLAPSHDHILTLRLLMYIYGAPFLDVSRSHTTTQHSR